MKCSADYFFMRASMILFEMLLFIRSHQNIRMDWFCSCLGDKKKTATIQAFTPIDSDEISIAYPTTHEDITIARATPLSVKLKIKKEADRVKPLTELPLPSSANGYMSIQQLKKKSGKSTVFRKIEKSNFAEEFARCKRQNAKFTDPTFSYQKVGLIADWKRISDILPNPTFMQQQIRPNDIIMGRINDCYWLSAVASIAERDYRIKNLFGTLEANPYGIYMCKLTYNGVYQQIVVDDYFPVDKDGSLLFARPYKGNDFWVLVLQKCWAKIFGSYQKINWGFNPQSLYTLTGAPVREYYTVDFLSQSEYSSQLFNILTQEQENRCILTCALQNKRDVMNLFNLQVGHSYSILGVFETKYQGSNIKLVQLRNPLGNIGVIGYDGKIIEQPNLPYNAKDKFWSKITPQQKSRLQFWMIQKAGDGIFYVQWDKYITIFDQIATCKINENAHYLYEKTSFAHGQSKYINLQIYNPTQFYLIIAQENKRRFMEDAKIQYATISVLVSKVNVTPDNRQKLEYVLSKSYYSDLSTNYFPVDLGLKVGGNFKIRINVTDPNQNETKVTVGYYSPDDFAVKFIDGVDDIQFVNRSLLNKAGRIHSNKRALANAVGWCSIENIIGSDLCYIAYHVASSSQFQKYRIKIDESTNREGLYFLGEESGKKAFQQVIQRGQQVIFVYTYTTLLTNPDILPETEDIRPLPIPIFEPIA